MRKVLISFLGTGPFTESNGLREYRTARYRFPDEKEYETPFLAAALSDHYGIDKIILVGTVKSMWEEVYRTFSHGEKDEDYYARLGDYCEQASHCTPLELPEIQKLTSAIGELAQVVLIHYGLTPEEIEHNQEIILSIEQYLENGDELYVDITHSFRSLPLFLLNTLIYAKNVSKKRIAIKHIHYGMFEAKKEMGGFTPVVDLSPVLDTIDWIVGAYAFQESGNAYKIAEKLEENDKSAANRLVKFSDMMNLNYLYGIQHQTDLHSLINKDYPSRISEMTLQPVISSFCSTFKQNEPAYRVQLHLTEWHAKHHNYSSAFISAQEAMISYICSLNGWDGEDRNCRDKAKSCLFGAQIPQKQRAYLKCLTFNTHFMQINEIRNSIAHSIPKEYSVQDMIRVLNDCIRTMQSEMV